MKEHASAYAKLAIAITQKKFAAPPRILMECLMGFPPCMMAVDSGTALLQPSRHTAAFQIVPLKPVPGSLPFPPNHTLGHDLLSRP
jgi:hypothetical protein